MSRFDESEAHTANIDAAINDRVGFWHKNLRILTTISLTFKEDFYNINSQVKVYIAESIQAFVEGLVHDFEFK